MPQIVEGGQQDVGLVSSISQQEVTLKAKKPSQFAGDVVVVNLTTKTFPEGACTYGAVGPTQKVYHFRETEMVGDHQFLGTGNRDRSPSSFDGWSLTGAFHGVEHTLFTLSLESIRGVPLGVERR